LEQVNVSVQLFQSERIKVARLTPRPFPRPVPEDAVESGVEPEPEQGQGL
jgi:hypothetical protein